MHKLRSWSILLSLIIIWGCGRAQKNLEHYGPFLAISKDDLEKQGVGVEFEPQFTYDKPAFVDVNGYQGAIMITYSGEGHGDFGYFIHFYEREQAAQDQFLVKSEDLRQTADFIIEENSSPRQFLLARFVNSAGKENLLYHLRYRRYILVILSFSSKVPSQIMKDIGELLIKRLDRMR